MIEFRSQICPLPMVDSLSLETLKLYRFHQNNILPLAGGLYDQRNLYLALMDLAAARFMAAAKRKKGDDG